MRIRNLHPWDVSTEQAIRIQKTLAQQVRASGNAGRIRTVAGADVSLDPATKRVFAAVIVYRYGDLAEIERAEADGRTDFPYVPGLLAFREGPVLLDAFAKLRTTPDLILFDGQGIAHPRRMGIASHLGLLLERPTVGCAKSRLVGEYAEPAAKAGSQAPLTLNRRRVGAAVRTRDGVKPIFVSPGHRVDIPHAVKYVLACTDGLRIPRPTREADRIVDAARRAADAPLRARAAGA